MDRYAIKAHNMVPDWMKNVKSGDLPEIYQEMAETIGVEATMGLAMIYSGTSVYFPKLDRALIDRRNEVIRREFRGDNVRMIARKWGLSARHVRQIVNARPAG